ncbi:hypothetical protein Xph01_02630 [Micromonospora phaseoli]|nr:hypothetical protein Xph01_02630 [Micromonospora phaseoli]
MSWGLPQAVAAIAAAIIVAAERNTRRVVRTVIATPREDSEEGNLMCRLTLEVTSPTGYVAETHK